MVKARRRGRRKKLHQQPQKVAVGVIDNLQKLLSGFVTGQITVAKVVVTVAAQSLHGEND